MVSVPAPLAPLENVFAAGQGEHSFLWAPSGSTQFVGQGVAAEVIADGEERFSRVRIELQALLDRVKCAGDGGPSPRVFGGFSFHPEAPSGPLWEGFHAAHFVLPRTCYARAQDQAWVSLCVRVGDLNEPTLVREHVGHGIAWLEGLMARRVSLPAAPPASLRISNVPDLDGWQRLVAAIQNEIAAGRFQKIVAARRAVCRLDPMPAPQQVLERLGEIAGDCARFAVRRGDKLFLGATPEWLIRKQGNGFQTEALAGSRSSRDPDAERELLSSQKDLREHSLVVEEILRAFEPLTNEIGTPQRPAIRRLRDILHLHTPIAGSLREATDVLDLVERLHPTPAVGGAPRLGAQRWIAEHEPEKRGWYASPVGWVDRAGDGEFVVALRSALLVDNVAHIFAGAGIVAESDADLEFRETELKLAAMSNALGAT
ncbi:MAG TPA: isochorismate synthase [Polyangiaceae bacterium]